MVTEDSRSAPANHFTANNVARLIPHSTVSYVVIVCCPLRFAVAALVVLVGFGPIKLEARVIGIQITSRTIILAGREFGAAGAYEKLSGRITFSVKPGTVHNRQIVDLPLAPRDSDGSVQFSADFSILKPKDMGRGNGSVLFEVSNRGSKNLLAFFNGGSGTSDPSTIADFGDGFLLTQGYTLAWVGWQADVADDAALIRLYSPKAKMPDGSAITGLVRADFTPWRRVGDWPVGHFIAGLMMGGTSYPALDSAEKSAVLTVRDSPHAPRVPLPRTAWQFGRMQSGELKPDPTSVHLSSGFEKGRIYEVLYEAQNPRIAGLGFAAVRDFISYLKSDPKAPTQVSRAYAIGVSQSGRFLRDFLYQDFNADETGRKVFDGIIAHVAGAGRGSFNHRFAQPSRDAEPMSCFDYPTDLFPFTDLPEKDPITGEVRGLLDLPSASGTVPRIFLVNTSYEYWGRAASLIHTTADGKEDAPISPDVRIYFLTGLEHFSGPMPPAYETAELLGQKPANPNPVIWVMRALLTDLNEWVQKDAPPPDSRYPRLSDHTLVTYQALALPKIPDVTPPSPPQEAFHMDFGPQWKEGIVTREPPIEGPAFPVFVPQVDNDGNELAGVRIPELTVPLATYTGWSLRDPSIGAPSERVSFMGSYIPFPRTEVERQKSGDPRPSIAERYHDSEDYKSRYAAAAQEQIRERFLLPGDLAAVIKRGSLEWRVASNPLPPKPKPIPEEVVLPLATLQEYLGTYPLRPSLILRVTEDKGTLYVQAPGQPRVEALASSKDEFFFTAADVQISFQRDPSGKVNGLVFHQNGRNVPAKKDEATP